MTRLYYSKLLFFITLFLLSFSCSDANTDAPEIIVGTPLKDLIDITAIDSVEMSNNYGKHMVTPEKLKVFCNQLGEATYVDASLKMGAIHFTVYTDGNSIPFAGRTHGQYLETHTQFFPTIEEQFIEEWVYFKVKTFNLDNY